jgi:xylulokinase
VTDDAYVCHHVVEGLHGQILSLVNGGSAFSWALELTGHTGRDPREIERLLQSVPPGSAGLRCWPFFVASGVAGLAPGTDARLSGLQLSHRPGHLFRAVVEGLACEVKRHLDFLGSWTVARLVLTGGAASGQVTPQILADATGLPLACAGAGTGSPLGAAIIARGLLESTVPLADLAENMAPPAREVAPGSNTPFYEEHFREYLNSLPAPP